MGFAASCSETEALGTEAEFVVLMRPVWELLFSQVRATEEDHFSVYRSCGSSPIKTIFSSVKVLHKSKKIKLIIRSVCSYYQKSKWILKGKYLSLSHTFASPFGEDFLM